MEEKKAKILIVDDDSRIRRMLKDYFSSFSYQITEAKDGEEALDVFLADSNEIDLIVLDVMMPGMDGIAVIKEIRKFSDVPVIFLSARSEEYDQVLGLEKGADDYLAKPFSPKVLKAHIEAILKRCKADSTAYAMGELEIDEPKHQIKVCGKVTDFTPKEYELLLYLIQNRDIAVSREKILNNVWNYDYLGDLRTVDTHIKQLRAKLTKECGYIKTVHGYGYRFEV